MNIKRIATLSAAGAVLAAMIAGATTGSRRPAPIVTSPNTTGIELQGAELAAEVARLRARLRPTEQPQDPARNLFQFTERAPRAAAPVAPPPIDPPAPAAPPAPPLSLIGFASQGAARTAIISGFGDLFLAKEGDRIAGRYSVNRVDADGVDVTSLSDGATITLRLQQ